MLFTDRARWLENRAFFSTAFIVKRGDYIEAPTLYFIEVYLDIFRI